MHDYIVVNLTIIAEPEQPKPMVKMKVPNLLDWRLVLHTADGVQWDTPDMAAALCQVVVEWPAPWLQSYKRVNSTIQGSCAERLSNLTRIG